MNAMAVGTTTTTATLGETYEQRRQQARAQWQVRCLELAFHHGLVGTAHLDHENCVLGVRVYRVPNSDRRGDGYVVSVCGDHVTCTCPAAIYSHGKLACGHAGAVIHYERQRCQTSTRDDAWDWWMAGGQW